MNQMHVITVFVETAEMSSFRNAARKRKVIGHRLRELSGRSKPISSDGSSNVLHGGLCPAAHETDNTTATNGAQRGTQASPYNPFKNPRNLSSGL